MDTQLKIEHYLLQVDHELHALPMSQRAEIITEIKSRIRREGLATLGPAKLQAESYLQKKGLTPTAKSRVRANSSPANSKWRKWLAVSTVGFFAIVFLSGLNLIWAFRPGPLRRLTRWVHDQGTSDAQLVAGGRAPSDAFSNPIFSPVEGRRKISSKQVRLIRIPFQTAKLDVESSTGSSLSWSCQSNQAQPPQPDFEITAGVATLNLDALVLARCLIHLPIQTRTEIRGVNGHMDVKSPAAGLDIRLLNGKVNVETDPSKDYDFDVRVKNGLQDLFPRSSRADAVKVKISVTNGTVKKE